MIIEESVIFAAVGLLGTGVGAVVAIAVRNATKHTENHASAKAGQAIANEAKEAAVAAQRLAASVQHDLAMYREEVAKEYATINLIDRLEQRLVQGLDRIADRFDRFMADNKKAS